MSEASKTTKWNLYHDMVALRKDWQYPVSTYTFDEYEIEYIIDLVSKDLGRNM